MRSDRFAIGVLAGVLLASGVVFASSFAFAPAQSGPAYLNAEVTSSTTTASTTSSALGQLYATATNSTTATSTCTCQSVFGSSITAGLASSAQAAGLQPPSRLGSMLGQPEQSLLLLAPVVLALLLGFAFYKGSAPGD